MMPRLIDWYKRELKPASSISWQVAGFYAMYIHLSPIILTSQSSMKFHLFWRLWPPSLPSFGGCVTTIPSSMARVRTSFINVLKIKMKTIGIHSNIQVRVAASLKTSRHQKTVHAEKYASQEKSTTNWLHHGLYMIQISNPFKLFLICLLWSSAGHALKVSRIIVVLSPLQGRRPRRSYISARPIIFAVSRPQSVAILKWPYHNSISGGIFAYIHLGFDNSVVFEGLDAFKNISASSIGFVSHFTIPKS